MKNMIVVFSLALALFSSNLYAQASSEFQQKSTSAKFTIHELVLLPSPGRVVKQHAKEIGITKRDMMRIQKEVKAVYVPLFQDKIRQAYTLEQKVKRMVAIGKTKADVKQELDKIAKLKREAIDYKIDALNKFREVLGEAKWHKILELQNR